MSILILSKCAHVNANQFEIFAWNLDDWTTNLGFFSWHVVPDFTFFITNFNYSILSDVAALDESYFRIRNSIAKNSDCWLFVLWDRP